jgi:hypothetical protein
MDIKHKTCDIRFLKKHSFLHKSSINIATLVPPLYQCVETRSIEVLTVVSATPHLRFNLFVISEIFATFLDPVVNRFSRQNTSHNTQETFLYEHQFH